jgi:hypothetical protein
MAQPVLPSEEPPILRGLEVPRDPYPVALEGAEERTKPILVRNKKGVLELQEGKRWVYEYMYSDGQVRESFDRLVLRDDRPRAVRHPLWTKFGEHCAFMGPIIDWGAKVGQIFLAIRSKVWSN